MKFDRAVAQLLLGKSLRRASWPPFYGICVRDGRVRVCRGHFGPYWKPTEDDWSADDWEVTV